MQQVDDEGLVLRTVEYKQRQRIITLFTKNHGLIHLIVKKISRKKSDLLSLTTPFSIGEFQYIMYRSDLYSLEDAMVKNANLELRKSLSHLEAAAQLTNAVLASQMPGKSSPLLYHLITCYLKQAPLFENPSLLTGSFLLKLLKHEGLLFDQRRCAHCSSLPTHLFFGEPLCNAHASPLALKMDQEEWNSFFFLLETTRFSLLKKFLLKETLHNKIIQSFQQKYPIKSKPY